MEAHMYCMNAALVAITVFLPGSGAQQPENLARSVLMKAIKAHGGEDRFRQFNTCRMKYKGTFYLEEKKAMPLEVENWENKPLSHKGVLSMTFDEGKLTFIQVVTGSTGWRRVGDEITDLTKDELDGRIGFDTGLRLFVEFLDPSKYKLAVLPEKRIDSRTLLGVRVSANKKADVDLYIDSETSLLSSTSSTHLSGRHKGKLVVEVFENYRDVSSTKISHKKTVFKEGKKYMEADLQEIEILKKLSPSVFAKPAK